MLGFEGTREKGLSSKHDNVKMNVWLHKKRIGYEMIVYEEILM